ncbi:MAG: VTT domain-containing protein [Anaeromicrobium sp.]|jgi:uncharacterized membrane protein YdjX (TVP38/TMEM64 family)|uniref:TVP38/TMEM64 family protein n=1 Tax=Anaeromicrobium sp. TaxID=1929132 RepID=UPI0025DF449D|nr:VTT domain-containing protein [Anaeromicrobium sp.]MCT4595452.1 VTT domain-containing protein [Anaeromicrobium sp.]
MKINKKYFIVIIWIVVIYFIKKNNIISLDTEILKKYISINEKKQILLFMALWVIRLLFLIPGVTLMILGGLFLGPMKGFLVSMAGMILSETIVYLFAKTVFNSKVKDMINNKYQELSLLIKKYNYGFLALGILCPIAPTDVICFLSASAERNYIKYMFTIIIANLPIILLCSYIGIDYKENIYGVTLMLVSTSMIIFYSLKTWYHMKNNILINEL